MSDNDDEANRPRWILFERDWSPQWPLAIQARRLVDNRLASGVSTYLLLAEQQRLRASEPGQSIRWMFYNAVVIEIESRF